MMRKTILLALIFVVSCSDSIDHSSSVKTFRPLYTESLSQSQLDYTFFHYDLLILSEPTEVSSKWDFSRTRAKLFVYRNILFSADWMADFSVMNTNESWFVHDENGNRIKNLEFNSYLMNVSNPDYITHTISAISDYFEVFRNFDGVFLDDFWSYVYPTAPFSQPAPDWFTNGFKDFMTNALRRIKKAFPDREVIVNSPEMDGDYVSMADGVMDEGFVHSEWMSSYVDKSYVSQVLDKVKRYSELGKTVLLISSVGDDFANELDKVHLYTLASYLLVSGGDVYYFYRGTNKNYDSFVEVPDFYSQIELGAPVESYRETDSGLFVRHFENGVVIVNPNDYPLVYFLEKPARDVYTGYDYGTVQINGKSGMILVYD